MVQISNCGCNSSACSCALEGILEDCIETTVSGVGSLGNKYKISSIPVFDPESDDCLNCTPDGFRLFIDPAAENSLTCGEDGLYVAVPIVEDVQIFSRDEAALTVGTGTNVLMLPFDITILGVSAAVGVAPTGANLILDVNMGGTTLFTTQANRPRVVAGNTDTGITEAVPNIVAIPAFSHLTVDRDQVGSAIAGGYLSLFVRYERV